MMIRDGLIAAVLATGTTLTLPAHAEEAGRAEAAATPPSAAFVTESHAESGGHASGLMVQARVQSQSSLLSLGAGSGFLVGYQGPSYSLGLGFGLTRVGINASGDSASLTLLQVAPTATIDVWHSADGRARANFIGSVGYARASLSATGTTQSCTVSGTGVETCTSKPLEGTASATLIPVMLGFGGDYFLSRNFALGAEFGLQALFLADAGVSSGSSSQKVDAGANAQFAYGALRATFVLGD